MKKIVLFFLLFSLLFGCKKEESINVQTTYKLVDFIFKSPVPSQTNTFKIEISYNYNGRNYIIVDGAYINLRNGVYQIYQKVPVGSNVRYNFSEFTEGVTVETYIERIPIIPLTYISPNQSNWDGSFIVR